MLGRWHAPGLVVLFFGFRVKSLSLKLETNHYYPEETLEITARIECFLFCGCQKEVNFPFCLVLILQTLVFPFWPFEDLDSHIVLALLGPFFRPGFLPQRCLLLLLFFYSYIKRNGKLCFKPWYEAVRISKKKLSFNDDKQPFDVKLRKLRLIIRA